MKRALVVLALVALTAGGLWVNWYARHRAVTPPAPPAPPPEQLALAVPYLAAAPAKLSPDDPVWPRLQPVTVPLTFQVLMIPWGKSDKGPVEVRAFHDGRSLYLRLEWSDSTEDRGGPRVEDLADAAALMFPLQAEQTASLMMGFLGRVNIWHWKANWDEEVWGKPPAYSAYSDVYPFENDPTFYPARAVGNLRGANPRHSAVEDIVSEGPGSITAKEKQVVTGRGRWQDGRWAVVVARALTTPETIDFQFASGQRNRMALAVWDGARGEKGSRKSISEWVWLELSAPPTTVTASASPESAR